MILHGDCLEQMKTLADNSVDAVVTDPPYGLSFMGKKWDYDVPSSILWSEAIRVLKPGGHLLSFGGTRTYHRLACAIEDAGFEIRDQLQWLYGSGFPKSLDVSKAIDKSAGVKREREKCGGLGSASSFADDKWTQENQGTRIVDTAITDHAKQWQGWGTALKPANEPICLARKPLSEKTVALNVLKWGTGGINIDASRIGTEQIESGRFGRSECESESFGEKLMSTEKQFVQGRWPANLLLDETAAEMLDEQSGDSKSIGGSRGAGGQHGKLSPIKAMPDFKPGFGDSGGASRFFKVIKQDQYDIDSSCETVPSATIKSKPRDDNSALQSAQECLQQGVAANKPNKNSSALNVQSDSLDMQATAKSEETHFAQSLAMQNTDSESHSRHAKFAESCAQNTNINSVHEAVKTNFKNDHQSLQCLDSISDSQKCILYQDLASHVENLESIDITQIIQSCLRLFGSAHLATALNIPDLESDTASGLGQLRFRYQAKASKSERNFGLEGMPEKNSPKFDGGDFQSASTSAKDRPSANHHPTVKPIKLMEYLIKLITPPGGTVLDCFMGSGSTGVAAKRLGFEFIGIEMNAEYLEIAQKRIDAA